MMLLTRHKRTTGWVCRGKYGQVSAGTPAVAVRGYWDMRRRMRRFNRGAKVST